MSALPDLPDLATQAHILAQQHGINIPVSAQAEVFLRAVWGAMPTGSLVGLVGADEYTKQGQIRTTSTPEWIWWGEDLLPLLEWAETHNNKRFLLNDRGSIYWNAAARKQEVLGRYHGRGGLDELTHITSFFCDLDTNKRGYELNEGVRTLLSLPLSPSGIIFSGGGLQAVHILREPWAIPNEAAAREYNDYSRALYRPTFERAGLKLDTSVHDAAREMRLPGYVNRKPGRDTFARIIYWHPEIVYTPAEIRARVTLPPPKPKLVSSVLPATLNPTGTYSVSQDFIYYLIEGNKPQDRHPVIVSLALQAVRSGMPAQVFIERAHDNVLGWFQATNEAHRITELEQITQWAYTRDLEQDTQELPFANWLITVGDRGFEKASETEQVLYRDKTIIVPAQSAQPVTPATVEDSDPAQSLQAVRLEQSDLIDRYIAGKVRGMGTYLLLRTSPGAGKTYATLRAAEQYARAALERNEAHGQVAMLTLFKDKEHEWQGRVIEHGGNPSLYGYIVARNGDPSSAGYCALHAQAEQVASKHYNVVATLCARCPLKTQCDAKWYLAQFPASEKYPILLGRHQHGVIQELMKHRKLVIFDESPLDIVAGAIKLVLTDIALPEISVFMLDQYPEQIALLKAWVKAVHDVVALNTALQAKQYPTSEHVRLGGRWLFERLEHVMSANNPGETSLAQVAELDLHFIQEASKGKLNDTSPDAIAALPKNWLVHTYLIFRHEYQHHYAAGHTRWNSRLIPWANELRVYPMTGFNFQQQTKVLITDATGLPELYGKAFTYVKQSEGIQTTKPRQALVYEGKLEPKSQVIQYTGSDHAKTSLHTKKPGTAKTEKIVLATTNGEIEFDPEEFAPDPDTIQRLKVLITELVKKHTGSLLIVTYLEFANQLRKWNENAGLLPPEHIEHYRNLRGKNDFKGLEAVLLIGTPRIPHMDLLALAQVWYWQDALPIDETAIERQEVYQGYISPEDGKGRGYRYIGFADQRVNSLYLGMIAAEMRQCYERVRPNASVNPETGEHIEKHVYLASAFPCADHVDLLMNWATWWVDHVGLAYYDSQFGQNQPVFQDDYIKHVMNKTKCVYNTAKASFKRISAQKTQAGKVIEGQKEITPKEKVMRWLAEQPERVKLSGTQIARELQVRKATALEALKEFKAVPALQSQFKYYNQDCNAGTTSTENTVTN